MADITEMQIAAAVLDLVPHMDEMVVTLRVITNMLAARFGVDFATMRKHKEVIKELVMQRMERDEQSGGADSRAEKENRSAKRRANVISDESEDEDEDEDEDGDEQQAEDNASESQANEDDSDSDAPTKRKRSSSAKAAPAKRKASSKKAAPALKKPRQSADSPGLTALKDMARAARLLSPRVYAALKKLESENEQEELVRELLSANTIRFSGRYPQKREVDAVRKKKDFEKDMEGIDTSLIIEDTSSRPRRAARSSQVSYQEQLIFNQISSDEDGGGGSDDGASAERQHKPVGARRTRVEESEEEEAADASDSSEAEF